MTEDFGIEQFNTEEYPRVMDESGGLAKSTISMRKRKTALAAKGFKTANFALSPTSLDVIEQAKLSLGLRSREATVNAILERLYQNGYLRQELLTVTT